MNWHSHVISAVAVALIVALSQAAVVANEAQQAIDAASAQQKYAFIVFYKDNGPATQSMARLVQGGVASRSDRAAVAYVDVTQATNKPLVDQFDVGRAPMPLTLALAPNGAITGLFPQTITDAQIEKAFVSPSMSHCMKSMQDGKLVLILVQATRDSATPSGVEKFRNDPQFKDRVALVRLLSSDPAEAEFLRQLEVDPTSTGASSTVFLAPPAVLVGKFGPGATSAELAAALHKAGQCCDDPNCKHNNKPAGQPTTSASGTPRQTTPSTRRK